MTNQTHIKNLNKNKYNNGINQSIFCLLVISASLNCAVANQTNELLKNDVSTDEVDILADKTNHKTGDSSDNFINKDKQAVVKESVKAEETNHLNKPIKNINSVNKNRLSAKASERTAINLYNLPEYKPRKELSTETDNDDELPARKKLSFFERSYNYLFGDPDIIEVPKIKVTIINTEKNIDKKLVDNVSATLAELTVEELSNYKLILPRLRTIAREAAEAVGYYEADFKFDKFDDATLSVEIIANEPVRIVSSNIQVVSPQHVKAFDDILKTAELTKGKVFNHQDYRVLKHALTIAAKQLGFFDATWKVAEVRVRLPENVADIDMQFVLGERYVFGKTIMLDRNGDLYYQSQVKNQIEVNPKIINRLQDFKQGDMFDQKKLNAFRNKLLATQYFNSVDIKAEPLIENSKKSNSNEKLLVEKSLTEPKQDVSESKSNLLDETNISLLKSKSAIIESVQTVPKQVPIVLTLDSSKPNLAEIGFGYGTDTGFRVRGKVARNLFNRHGHKISVNAEAAKSRQEITFNYKKPFKNPLTDTVDYFVGYEREVRDSGLGDIKISKLTAGAQRNIGIGKWHKVYSIKYFLDDLNTQFDEDIVDFDEIPSQFIAGRDRQQLLLFGYGLNRSFLRGGIYPTEGVKQYIQAQVGVKDALSDVTLAIVRSGLSGVTSFGKHNQHQFVGSLSAAAIITNDFKNVPYNQRFFAGGDRSIRGFNYKSLSPDSSNGFLIGGQNLLLASAEYNYLVHPKWRLASFFDIGNAFDEKFTNPVKYSSGLGVRWLSPVGLVRVDVAAGISEEKPPIRLHFFIGPPL